MVNVVLVNIDNDIGKDILENINIEKDILENIDIGINIVYTYRDILEQINIEKDILEISITILIRTFLKY